MENNRIICPLLGENIDKWTCFDISMVAEGQAPDWSAPKEAVTADDFKAVCMKCEYHPE